MKKAISTELAGDLFIFAEAFLWGLFPIITILAYSALTPLYTAAISTLIAAITFALILTFQRRWHEIAIKSVWPDILGATIIIGVFFYILVFVGLRHTSAGNASIVGLMEVFFCFVVFSLLGKERLSVGKKIGAACMVIGALVILLPKHTAPNLGDILILVAASFVPFGNYFAQRARKKVGSVTIMFLRSIMSFVVLLVVAYFFEPLPGPDVLRKSFVFLAINGLLLLGFSKLLWLEAIHRIPVTKAISLSSISPAFTLLFAFLFLDELPTVAQIAGFFPIFAGVLLLTRKS
ncbi:hypothetical protein COV82_03565 [Candidatus Peregrinibacteria bacterium CG11_big_fil_rev_8_21_14_0_20_46_8]|nr:MAG: hypothetical protein COV82_03565 [Candidatus Peregrinibacteria bacterium CG11_big_fil_rev_8_21_14_0_20_46_8]